MQSPADPSGWYPDVKPDRRWLKVGLQRAAVLAAIVVAAVVGWRVWQGDRVPRPVARLVEAVRKLTSDEALNDGVLGVDCYTGARGEFITYDDASGVANIVESPAQVPARFRKTARCIVLQK